MSGVPHKVYHVGQAIVYTIHLSFMGGAGFNFDYPGTVLALLPRKKVHFSFVTEQGTYEQILTTNDIYLRPA